MFKVLSKERSINRIKRNKQLKPKRIHSTHDPGPHKLCLTQKKQNLNRSINRIKRSISSRSK